MYEIKDLLKQLLKDQEEIYSLVGKVLEIDENKRVCHIQPLDGSADIYDVRLQSRVSSETGLVLFPVLESEVTITFLSKELAYVSQTTQIEKILLNIGEFSLFIDEENLETNVKNSKLTTEEKEVTAKNVTFTVETLFKLISQQQIQLEAVNFLLKATNVNIEGITSIIGATTITGAATITAGASIAGGMAVTGGASINGGNNGGVPLSTPLVAKLNLIEADLNALKTAIGAWTPVNNDGGAALKAAISSYAGANLTPTTILEISNADFTQ